MVDRYALLGFATLLLGRDEEAIAWDQRALAANPDNRPVWHAEHLLHEAAANARLGHLEEAHRFVSRQTRFGPGTRCAATPRETSRVRSTRRQMERYREALRLAGLRDHADEGANFGTKSDDRLHEDDDLAGPTPTTAPGAATIRTEDLTRLLAGRTPIIVDTMEAFSGRSLPGAVGLAESGWGTSVADPMQDRLRREMAELTGGDRTRVIVVVGWSSERFRRPQSGAAARGTWLYPGHLVPRRQRGMGGCRPPRSADGPNSLVAGARDNAPNVDPFVRRERRAVTRARRTRQHAEILFSASDDASYVTGAPLVCSIMGMFLHSDRHWPSVIAKFSVSSAACARPHAWG